jgi:hypothetical protein
VNIYTLSAASVSAVNHSDLRFDLSQYNNVHLLNYATSGEYYESLGVDLEANLTSEFDVYSWFALLALVSAGAKHSSNH